MLAPLLLGFVGAGCYRYVPAPITTVGPAEEVRVRVTPEAAARLIKEFGTYTTELEGHVGRTNTDSVSVAVQINRDYRGVALESTRQVFYLGPTEVVAVRRRQLSRKRTLLLGGGALVVFGVIVGTVTQWGDPNTTVVEPPPPPPPTGRIIGIPRP
jgi:hypothetical protein